MTICSESPFGVVTSTRNSLGRLSASFLHCCKNRVMAPRGGRLRDSYTVPSDEWIETVTVTSDAGPGSEDMLAVGGSIDRSSDQAGNEQREALMWRVNVGNTVIACSARQVIRVGMARGEFLQCQRSNERVP